MFNLEGQRLLVTGHTGFKGTWLVLLAKYLGASVGGIALPPRPGDLFERLEAQRLLDFEAFSNIAKRGAFAQALKDFSPDYVVHLAGQAIVRKAFAQPVNTYDANAWASMNVVAELATAQKKPKRSLLVTSDKVYREQEEATVFSESHELGGDDPYSNSKALADSFALTLGDEAGVALDVARGGNVVGGGDRGEDRLIPDLIRALDAGEEVELRHPEATRPWQHVLDCLSGYLTILLRPDVDAETPEAWNVGPSFGSESVREVVSIFLGAIRQPLVIIEGESSPLLPEAQDLQIDPSKLLRRTGFSSKLTSRQAIEWTAEWELATRQGAPLYEATTNQIRTYLDL